MMNTVRAYMKGQGNQNSAVLFVNFEVKVLTNGFRTGWPVASRVRKCDFDRASSPTPAIPDRIPKFPNDTNSATNATISIRVKIA